MQNEFNIIEHYFKRQEKHRSDVVIGIGDDGAVTQIQPEHQLVTVTDTLVEGVHFDQTTPARAVGHKCIAVNLSDLAAMGAEPCWISLALTLPDIDELWLNEFAAGLHEVCQYFGCTLIGGDTTRGPLTVTVTAQGQLPTGSALTRDGAKAGDWLYVSGPLGDAGLALDITQQRYPKASPHLQKLVERLHYPTPRVALGQSLRGVASACIDVSDGLLADLQHILSASGVGVEIELDRLPLSLAMTETLSQEDAFVKALTAGDDYELCFTVEEPNRGRLETLTAHLKNRPICIGRIQKVASEPITFKLFGEEYTLSLPRSGYNHFANIEADPS
jgi:thiamine-monophosphate kinase